MDQPRGFPFPLRYYTWIGVTSLTWGQVELGLDTLVIGAFRTNRLGEKKAPASLNPKVAFLRKCCREHPAFADHAEAISHVLDRVQTLKEKRHDLIHGLAVGMNAHGALLLMRTRYGEDHDFSMPKYTIKQIVHLQRELRDLADSMLPLMYAVIGTTEEEADAQLKEEIQSVWKEIAAKRAAKSR